MSDLGDVSDKASQVELSSAVTSEGGVGGRTVIQGFCSGSSCFSVERFIRCSFDLGFIGSTCAALQQSQLLRHQRSRACIKIKMVVSSIHRQQRYKSKYVSIGRRKWISGSEQPLRRFWAISDELSRIFGSFCSRDVLYFEFRVIYESGFILGGHFAHMMYTDSSIRLALRHATIPLKMLLESRNSLELALNILIDTLTTGSCSRCCGSRGSSCRSLAAQVDAECNV
jgi:hypothetical protein